MENADFRTVLDQIEEGVAVWNHTPWRVVFTNRLFSQLTGLVAGVENTVHRDRSVVDIEPRLIEALDHFVARSDAAITVTVEVDFGSRRDPVDLRLFRMRPNSDGLIGMVVHSRSSDSELAATLRGLERRDPLTGLQNRAFLMEQLSSKLTGERGTSPHFAIIFFDLDNFKRVNDAFGHLMGDAVLREASCRIANCLRHGDHVVRYGGDEFVAMIEGISNSEEVESVINRVQVAFSNPLNVAGRKVSLSLSAGVALESPAFNSPEELIEAADRAMYCAKRSVGKPR